MKTPEKTVIIVEATIQAPVETVWKLWTESGPHNSLEPCIGRLAHNQGRKRPEGRWQVSFPHGG